MDLEDCSSPSPGAAHRPSRPLRRPRLMILVRGQRALLQGTSSYVPHENPAPGGGRLRAAHAGFCSQGCAAQRRGGKPGRARGNAWRRSLHPNRMRVACSPTGERRRGPVPLRTRGQKVRPITRTASSCEGPGPPHRDEGDAAAWLLHTGRLSVHATTLAPPSGRERPGRREARACPSIAPGDGMFPAHVALATLPFFRRYRTRCCTSNANFATSRRTDLCAPARVQVPTPEPPTGVRSRTLWVRAREGRVA